MLQLLVELLPGAFVLEGRMGLHYVVTLASAISQKLSLGARCEQLCVEELITEASIERFCKAVLPWGFRLDVVRAGRVAGLAPVP